MKRTASLLAAVAILLYFAAPSFAKKALDEGDLDRITAAGEPTIIQVSGVEIESSGEVDFEISYEDASTDVLTIEGATDTSAGGQENLRALVLNNVAGENLVANALNITGTISGGGIGIGGANAQASKQTNQITQSWGAVKITDVVTVTETVSVEGVSADGGDGGDGGNSGGSSGGFCIGLCNSKGSDQSGGDGGDGSTSPGQTALAAIAYPVWMSADVIIHVEDVSIDNSNGTTPEDVDFGISVFKGATTSLSIANAAQSDLSALIVNNVAGKNLIANAVNIAGGAISVGTGAIGLNAAGGGVFLEQSNTVGQYRGTPANAPQPVAIGSVSSGCGSVGAGSFSC
jgi:hypothetical protein